MARRKASDRLPTVWAEFAPLLSIESAGKVVQFNPYDYQCELVEAIQAHPNTVICKSRQMGISETIASLLLMRAATEPGFAAVVYSKNQAASSDLSRRIQLMAASLGDRCPPRGRWNDHLISFTGLGRIYFLPATPKSARSIPSVSMLFLDEAAFIDEVEKIYQAAERTMAMLGDRARLILNSTPDGAIGLYPRVLFGDTLAKRRGIEQAIARIRVEGGTMPRSKRIQVSDGWARVLIHWRQHPIYGADPDYAEKTKKARGIGDAQWAQEMELDFTSNVREVFRPEHCDRAAVGQWQLPEPGRRYVAAIVPTLNTVSPWCTQVWQIDREPYLLVYEQRDRGNPLDSLDDAIAACQRYQPVTLTLFGGEAVYEQLRDALPECRIETLARSPVKTKLITDRLSLYLQQGMVNFPLGSALVEQLPKYQENSKGVRGAAQGFADDAIQAAGTALFGVEAEQRAQSRLAYRRFDRRQHGLYGQPAHELDHDPGLPVHLSLDFNASPACAIAAQQRLQDIVIFKEWRIQTGGTEALAAAIADWLVQVGQRGRIVIHGDASGNQRTANSRYTNWAIVRRTFKEKNLTYTSVVGKANPAIDATLLKVDALLRAENLWFIVAAVPYLVNDLEKVRCDSKGAIEKSDTSLTHLSDCLRYLVWDLTLKRDEAPYDIMPRDRR